MEHELTNLQPTTIRAETSIPEDKRRTPDRAIEISIFDPRGKKHRKTTVILSSSQQTVTIGQGE